MKFDFNSKYFFPTVAVLSTIFTFIISYIITTGNWWLSAFVTVLVAVMNIIIIWLTKETSNNAVRINSFSFATLAIAAYFGSQSLFQSFLVSLGIIKDNSITEVTPIIYFGCVTSIVWIVNYYMRDRTAMGIHPKPIDRFIQKRGFKEDLDAVCIAMKDELTKIDLDLNWKGNKYVPLEAEIEV